MERVVTSIKLYKNLIVPIQIELDDTTVEKMQHQILEEVEQNNLKSIILDISMVDILDSYISYSLTETAKMAKLLGCDTYICGMQPMVSLTLAQMGVNIREITFVKDLEEALEMTKQLNN
ncbi:rsbT antagonist protein RsbS [Hypnocyclicus thermotrophus]|uniref:RsbT antagonist protein RsbS n=1 Tax=Hypnocyclicus thermotrophus TaxID=1627895 RepID=A0AA46E034_9FUSO|nr:STAS domain-containing protein [Hypnocyclicus thermotrophus]TDT72349.1 rsbT antagonist protein RsbS [Hypnocyclicus thermotrophus]